MKRGHILYLESLASKYMGLSFGLRPNGNRKVLKFSMNLLY